MMVNVGDFGKVHPPPHHYNFIFIPLPRGREPLPISCPYCGSSYDPKFMGTICTVCNLAKVGTETVGLVVYNAEV